MINFDNHNITGMSYNGHMIRKAYGCDARLVWESEHDYSNDYLTLIPRNEASFKFKKMNTSNPLFYSIDNGATWVSLASEESTPSVGKGQKVLFKGALNDYDTHITTGGCGWFSSTGNFDVEGNVMSLIYGDDFRGKLELTQRLGYLFSRCVNLISAENLVIPATTKSARIDDFEYVHMFIDCSNLELPPKVLPLQSVSHSGYFSMFDNCSKLRKVPEILATEADRSFYTMFYNCKSIVDASNMELKLNTIGKSECDSMFRGCTSLEKAPKVVGTESTVMSDEALAYMFADCTSLTTAPELPSTAATGQRCYAYMFANCSSLEKAPILPSETIGNYSYAWMFNGCTNLNEITCLAIGNEYLPVNSCPRWVSNVSPTGTFYKNKNMTNWTIGVDGIPTGWVVKDYSTGFDGKWKATYSDSKVFSAECDSTSAITSGEIDNSNLVSVEIGDCVTGIGAESCMYATSLSSVTIGSGVTSIGVHAFYNSVRNMVVKIYATTPPDIRASSTQLNKPFPLPNLGTKIYVPDASVNAYKTSTEGWTDYTSCIYPMSQIS